MWRRRDYIIANTRHDSLKRLPQAAKTRSSLLGRVSILATPFDRSKDDLEDLADLAYDLYRSPREIAPTSSLGIVVTGSPAP